MTIRRRDLVQLGVGAGAGLMLTPVPWKLLDDTAIWSQNWSWLPKLPRGERTTKETRCTLCPGGCAVTAQCVGGVPVYLKGKNAPLCVYGLGGHHLAYHADRLRQPNTLLESAAAKMSKAARRGLSVIVDQRPGRAMSEMYRRFAAALPDGKYVPVPPRDGATLRAMERIEGTSLGVDFDKLEAVVGIGTPLLDGWSAQSRLAWKKVIQIEARQSATAAAAGEWLPAAPGTEVRAALDLAKRLTGPALFVADGDAAAGFDPQEIEAIAALNLRTAETALSARRKVAWEEQSGEVLEALADRSIALLILGDANAGETIAWSGIERKLAPGALVVSFSPYLDSLTRRGQIVIPANAAYETAEDILTPPYAKETEYEIAEPLHPKPLGGASPMDVLRAVVPALEGSVEDIRKERAADLEKAGSARSAQKLKQRILPEPAPPSRPELAAVCFGWRGAGAGLSSPLITKLYQESGLRPGSLLARMHPDSARARGLGNRDRVQVEVNGVIREKTVGFDPAVLPGVIEITDSFGCRWAPANLRRLS